MQSAKPIDKHFDNFLITSEFLCSSLRSHLVGFPGSIRYADGSIINAIRERIGTHKLQLHNHFPDGDRSLCE